jgi:DNA-binding transcriptional ArsR family regulator
MTNFNQKTAQKDPLGELQKFVGLVALLLGAGYLGYRYRAQLLEYYQKLVDALEGQKHAINDERYDQAVALAKEVEKRLLDIKINPKPVAKTSTVKSVPVKAASAVVKKEVSDAFALNERQEIIYKLIRASKKAMMTEVEDVVPGVTSRTLRRDMNKLEKLGLIEKLGKTKDTYYKLRN